MKNFTPTQLRNFLKAKTVTFTSGDIQFYKSRGRTAWIDNRTERKYSPPDDTVVYPIALDEHRVFVVCPFCQSFHVHGRDADGYRGYRTSDCRSNPNYFIETIGS